MNFKICLPYPPSINNYYGVRGNRRFIKKEGKQFREDVIHLLKAEDKLPSEPFQGRVEVNIELHTPDKRRRDLDNVRKAVYDAMTNAGVWKDDCQVYRDSGVKIDDGNNCVVVEIKQYEDTP